MLLHFIRHYHDLSYNISIHYIQWFPANWARLPMIGKKFPTLENFQKLCEDWNYVLELMGDYMSNNND